MSVFLKAFLLTLIPVIVLSTIGTVGSFATRGSATFTNFGAYAAVLWGMEILAAIGLAIAREREIAGGILAGVGIGAISLGVTCFAVFTSGYSA